MKSTIILLLFTIINLTFVLAQSTDSLRFPDEKHLKNIKQLTFGGQNAEAYFSFDESRLIFQSERDSFRCDQIFSMNVDGSNLMLLNSGKGKTTCAFFLPGDTTFLFASTHLGSDDCPPKPDYSKGYIWSLVKSFDIFMGKVGSKEFKRITTTDGYDAEATVSPKGDKIIFTSVRDGDLELYSMDLEGKNVLRLTNEIGYDGGAFYSWDGSKIVFRANHPTDSTGLLDYQQLLRDGMIRPGKMEIFVMNADGSGKKQITDLGTASFAPFFHPNGSQIIFSTNYSDQKGRNFDLYLVNTDGSGLERVTYNNTFDGFPMFTRDGTKIVFASNRNGKVQGETNIFIADWVP
ncbi:MAG: PD40 domain-containing protein [Ignavibacteriae bacterium]|nr:PD40 domain-containing protein [Ignavibacteriota bacterium]